MIDNSRKRRIANGAGVPLPEVNRLLKQFDQMQKTMKKMVKGGMLKNMMRGMAGRMPPERRSVPAVSDARDPLLYSRLVALNP